MKMDWIPNPKTWAVIGANAKDQDINLLNDVVFSAIGKNICSACEITLNEREHLKYFEGAFAGGLSVAGTVAAALKKHSCIRVRYEVV